MSTETRVNFRSADQTPSSQSSPGTRLAKILSELFAPLIQVLAQSALALRHATAAAGLGWWLLASFFGSALPMLFLIYGTRRGSWLDHHVPQREQRIIPMLVILSCLLIGTGAFALSDAPNAIRALFLSLEIQLAALTAITRWWKISVHTSVAASTVAVTAWACGPLVALAVAPMVPITMWTRTHLKAHTLPQATAGVLVGAFLGAVSLTHLM
ncbi:hypothetical protein [Streptomyces sp. GbtcB6]|uniref:hypothetical protein n=1 Tax=Streptomyces sp. GbtcB6 TaxID=2824751 RepID=UPI001C30CFB5|nr:hypothetical protein [Streptomyces sp. GbtcB6]